MQRLRQFRYWLGTPAGAMWYFGVCYFVGGALVYWWFDWR